MCARLETLDRQLQDRKTSFTSLDADMKEFLSWLIRVEVAVTHYEEMVVTDLSTNEDQQSKSQRAFNVRVFVDELSKCNIVIFTSHSFWTGSTLLYAICVECCSHVRPVYAQSDEHIFTTRLCFFSVIWATHFLRPCSHSVFNVHNYITICSIFFIVILLISEFSG